MLKQDREKEEINRTMRDEESVEIDLGGGMVINTIKPKKLANKVLISLLFYNCKLRKGDLRV